MLPEGEQIEQHVHHRDLVHGAAHVARAGEVDAPPEALEARPAALVEGHDLAVEHDAFGGQRRERAGDLGVARAGVAARAVGEAHPRALFFGQDPHAVELQLVQEVRVVEGGRRAATEHGHELGRRRVARRSAQGGGLFLDALGDGGRLAELFHGEPGEHAARGFAQHVALFRGERVAFFEQQPLVLRVLQAHEGEATAQLVAREHEVELALLEALFGGEVEEAHLSTVPHDHGACAVVSVRDHALEIEILDGVILGVDGQVFGVDVEARPLGYGEAREHPRRFEAQIVVAAGRVVQVHHVRAVHGRHQRAARLGAHRLGGAGGVAFFPVVVELHEVRGKPASNSTTFGAGS